MPIFEIGECQHLSPLIRRYERELLARGCSPGKAYRVARRKAARRRRG